MTHPSEQTIVVNANRFLLNKLLSPNAWILCCTTNQEAALGWDASLEGLKQLYIQYKGVCYTYSNNDVRVNIDPAQRAVLHAFSASVGAPAFYGFCDYGDYAKIDLSFAAAPPALFFDHCAYVCETNLPLGTAYLRGSNLWGWSAYGLGGIFLGNVAFLTGPQLASEVRDCRIGAPAISQKKRVRAKREFENSGLKVSRVFAPLTK